MERWNAMIAADRSRWYREQGLWTDDTILSYFSRNVERTPEKVAIVDCRKDGGRQSISYAALDEARRSWAARFVSLGVGRGDVVSFQLPNWWEFAGIYLACETIGAVANPLMPIFRELELEAMLGLAGSRVLIIPTEFRNFKYEPMAATLKERLPALAHVLTVEQLRQDLEVRSSDCVSLASAADDVVELLYTSGTTGVPKGVMHTGNTLLSALRPFIATLQLTDGDVVFMGSPLGHQTGFLYGMVLPLILGGKAIFQDVWDARRAIDIMEADRVTFTMASTPFLTDLANPELTHGRDISAFRTFICGGAAIPRELVQRGGELLGARILSIWGMTECGIVTLVRPDDPPELAFTTDGAPLPSYDVRVIGDGMPASASVQGELQIRGPSCAVGYLERSDLFPLDAEAWFSSGDLGSMDAQGYVRISGRSKDIIIRGGENVPVVEVEMALLKHPAVRDVALVAMPDKRLGERGCAFVVASDAGFTIDEMRTHLNTIGMAKDYWPEHVELVPELPRTPSGKVQKFLLRQWAENVTPTLRQAQGLTKMVQRRQD
ncbi:AMP-binding protein [Cupriavidus numazuensis]|uniref:Medium-chain fatty-acid--CoA ligase n=1 Tax=Cupriavidus numazuensis TaxID=221992 RepID=A0ABM8TWR6_9BURK|nr:AMP-binding protein [Cupriavidus numazuensis]CAG2161173.1 Medium-chain fatty-acid--CoA ligase [Cupriavidus numazuensis]